ncbi:MAG: hypothetical protein DME82_05215 [Verrucomicrobia bacterium]|nr:MAG: hypothetical protein DME82_05215 [Verrucomicrobiota bacterium]
MNTCITLRYSARTIGCEFAGCDALRDCANTTIVTAAKHSKTPSATRSLKNPPSLRLRRAGADLEADFFFIGWILGWVDGFG